jgi:GNAT superfamily N-acetyltransferase
MAVRLFEARDIEALADLMAQMQAHYRVPCPPRADIVASLQALPPGNRILVVDIAGHLLGFAAFAEIWPGPGLVKGLFLKELYVSAAARGAGHGRALMAALARIAKTEGHGRIDWTAERDNGRLLAFYDGLSAERQPKKLFYRLAGAALDTAAGDS